MSLSKRLMARICVCAAVLGAIVALVLHFCRCSGGRDKAPAAPDQAILRANDAEYKKKLVDHRAAQARAADGLAKVEAQLEAVRAKARVALGADATDAQAEAEVAAHPERYPEWKGLVALRDQAAARIKARQREAREAVRARILKEQADRDAARRGKAAAAR